MKLVEVSIAFVVALALVALAPAIGGLYGLVFAWIFPATAAHIVSLLGFGDAFEVGAALAFVALFFRNHLEAHK